MLKRELERVLNTVPHHPSPKAELEQYATPSTLAATLLWLAEHHFGDIADKVVADLGAGTGRLGIGAALLGAYKVVLVEVDDESIRQAWTWVKDYGIDIRFDALVADVNNLPLRSGFLFDTVVQNPPFGVHRRGADMAFLRTASRVARVVYSIHKESSIDYVAENAIGWGFKVLKVYSEKICLPWMFEWHKKRRHCFPVVVIRLERV
ncbi:MAG: METTL5 family protein [Infirmifilum sp.]